MFACCKVLLDRTTDGLEVGSAAGLGNIGEIGEEMEVVEGVFSQMESAAILRRGNLNIHCIEAVLLHVNGVLHPSTILGSGSAELIA